MKFNQLLVAFLVSAACLLPTTVFAADGDTLFVGVTGGFGGNFNGEWDSTLSLGSLQANLGGDIDDVKMESTWGAIVHYDSSLHPYFALGARVSLLGFTDRERADAGWSRNLAADIAIAPRLRYELVETPVELYATLPIGVSILKASSDWRKEANLDFEWGVGFNISALLGATFSLSDSFGLFVEAGWALHTVYFDGEIASGVLVKGTDVNMKGDFGQFVGSLGIVLAL